MTTSLCRTYPVVGSSSMSSLRVRCRPVSSRSSTPSAEVRTGVSMPRVRCRDAMPDSILAPVSASSQRRSDVSTQCHVGRSTCVRTTDPDARASSTCASGSPVRSPREKRASGMSWLWTARL